jgi:bifunctional DNA-binding transcriptional regulator/antitoxin component of YhaV-PrlF toxin-antitoxin module
LAEKSVAEKLSIKPGDKVLIINAPQGYEAVLRDLPQRIKILEKLVKGIDFIQLFVSTQAELEVELAAMTPLLKPTGLLWVSYPKRTSNIKTDINRDRIKAYAKIMGLRGASSVSINDIWSSLRLKIA